MQGMKVTCHKINSGYGTDYGHIECEVVEVVSLDGVPTIKVKEWVEEGAVGEWVKGHMVSYEYLAWYRNGEWVLDLD